MKPSTSHILLCIMAMILSLGRAGAQNLTTMGTDFWITNTVSTDIGWAQNHSDVSSRFLLTGPRSCSVRLTSEATGLDTTIQLTANTAVDLFNIANFRRTIQTNLYYSRSVHITSTDSISVYFDEEQVTRDIANILPTYALRSDYIIQTYPSTYQQATAYQCSNFSILAVEDSTIVVLDVEGSIPGGDTLFSQYTILLPHAGDCYQVISTANGDLSGTHITALNGKKIAVFQGNNNAKLPSATPLPGLLFEQALPTTYWGRHFFVPKTADNNLDRVRITAFSDNCAISVNNQVVATIAERETYEYEISSSTGVDYISTSTKACVCRYSANTGYWTPTMVTIMPWEQSSEAITTLIPHNNYYEMLIVIDSAYIDITMKTAETNMMRVDGAAVGDRFTTISGNPAFSQARLKLPYGVHSLYTTDGEGFIASAFYIYQQVSFSFPVGSALREMQNSLTIGDREQVTWMDTIRVCDGEQVTMSVESMYTPDSVVWHLSDGTHATGQQLTHSFTSVSGVHRVTAIVYSSCVGCYRQIDTLTSNIRVSVIVTEYSDSIICGTNYTWQDSTYTDGQQLVIRLRDHYGCDSISIITLHLIPTVYGNADTLRACDSIRIQGRTYTRDTTVVIDTLTSTLGCDSILFSAIDILPSYHTIQNIIIRDTTSLTWIDGETYTESTESPFIVLQSRHGCDSIIHLHLSVLPVPPTAPVDSSVVWVPNIFTPDEETNSQFIILTNDILSAEVSIFSRQESHICTFDGMTEGWDGTLAGKPCPQGSYVYLIVYTTKAMPQYKQRKTGTVTILR